MDGGGLLAVPCIQENKMRRRLRNINAIVQWLCLGVCAYGVYYYIHKVLSK